MKNARKLITSLLTIQALTVLIGGEICLASQAEKPQLCTKIPQSVLPKTAQSITIFVHGTRGMTRFFPNMPWASHDMLQHCGISRATDASDIFLFARLARALSQAEPTQFPLENIYLYGWSGDLDFMERKHAAERLSAFVQAIRMNEASKDASITIITHSHGGNVALNLAAIYAEQPNRPLLVDRLILLACPVQEATKQYIHSPIFKQVFNIYSTFDLMQVLDPQGLYEESKALDCDVPIFSERRFDDHPNLIQIKAYNKIQVTAMLIPLSHVGFITQKFIQRLPSILDAASVKAEDQLLELE